MSQGRRDTLLAVLVGMVALALYLRTMYPGLVGSGDTPELQFAGYVLGTPHVPGYPLYMLLSYAFSRLPVGSVAYRVNLMSGVFGAVAAALLSLLLRRLDCRAWAAGAIALAAAFGPAFWSQSTLAEVYTLAAALLCGVLASLVEWDATGRSGAFHRAAAFAGLALAHHYSDVVTAAPALALFVLVSPRRRELRRGDLALGVLLLASGVALYGLIVLRTLQHAPYLGAQATTLGQLVDVMRGGRFGSRLFAFDVRTILFERLPSFVRLGLAELGPGGAGLLAVGAVSLGWRRPRHATLFLVGALGNVFFALNYDVPDVAVFLLPAFVLLWPVAGAGLEAVATAAPAVAVLALLLPVAQVVANYRASDHHGRTFEMRYFKAVFDALPDRSALVTETYTVDQMARYEMLAEGFAGRKDVAFTGRDAESIESFRRKGHVLFAFERGRQELAAQGFRFAPVKLQGGSLPEALAEAPRGSFVVAATSATGSVTAQVAGDATAAREGRGELRVGPIRLIARKDGALVEVNGRVAARVDSGIAAAVVLPTGRVLDRYELDADDGLRVPFGGRAFPLFRMAGGPACADVGNRGFVDVTYTVADGRILGRIDNFRPFDARFVLYAARDRPLAPRLVEAVGRVPVVDVRILEGASLLHGLESDGLGRTHPLAAARFVARVDVRVNDQGESSAFSIDLGGRPSLALVKATVDRDNPRRGQVCAVPVGGADFFASPADRWARVPLGPDGAPFLGSGWRGPERDGPVEFRWIDGTEAELLAPLARTDAMAIRLLARAAPGAASPAVAIAVNGRPLGSRALGRDWSACEWVTPREVWRLGLNEVVLRASAGAAVGAFRLRLSSPPGGIQAIR